jgi:ribosomal protein S18 acetylase RimI-like enzyme
MVHLLRDSTLDFGRNGLFVVVGVVRLTPVTCWATIAELGTTAATICAQMDLTDDNLNLAEGASISGHTWHSGGGIAFVHGGVVRQVECKRLAEFLIIGGSSHSMITGVPLDAHTGAIFLSSVPHYEPFMSTVVLRPIQRTDLDQVIALQNAAFGFDYDRERVWDGLFDVYTFNSFVAVHSDTGAVVGFVLSWGNAIVSLMVDEKHHRRTVGKHLLRLCLNSHFPELVTLHVSARNAGAQAMYFDAGFVETGRVADYYKRPVSDALVLERPADAAQWFNVPYEIPIAP